MRFKYNDVEIGEGATGTYSSDTKVDSQPTWSWSFNSVTWSCTFTKKTATETLMHTFETGVRNTLTGLCKISANLEITYADGSTDTYKEEPAGAQPTGISQNPILEVVPDEFSSATYKRYKFTVQFEMPTAFNGVKVMQTTAAHDALGYQNIQITGIMPSQYLNGSHDAIKAFDTYFTSKIEKAVLSTFLGKDYYKRVDGPNITSEKGLGSLGNLSEGRWKSLSFDIKYKQVAFAEQSDKVVSEYLMMPLISVTQLPETGKAISMPSVVSGGGAGGDPGSALNGSGNVSDSELTYRYSVQYETGVTIDNDYLGANEKAVKLKKKGYEAKFSGLADIYHKIVRQDIIKKLQDIFGGDIALYNEQVTYTNEPRIRVSAMAFPSKDASTANRVYRFDSFAYTIQGAFNYKLLDGQDYTMVRIEPGKMASGTFTRTQLSAKADLQPWSPSSGWKIDSYGITSAREAGAIYSNKTTSASGRIKFAPLYEVISQYNVSAHGDGGRVSVLGEPGGGGGGGERPTIGVGIQ